MIEYPITWKHALRFRDTAKIIEFMSDHDLGDFKTDTSTLLQVTTTIPLIGIRNWINDQVGRDYTLTAISRVGNHMASPNYFKFGFSDQQTNMLFKLTWY